MFNTSTLEMLGYTAVLEGERIVAICRPGTNPKMIEEGSERFTDIEHMCGRLSNLHYMAAAIDKAEHLIDEIPATDYDRSGEKQFQYLMSQPHLMATGLIYIALRGFQRTGDIPRMRAALTLLIEHERHGLDGRDAVALIFGLSKEHDATDQIAWNYVSGAQPIGLLE